MTNPSPDWLDDVLRSRPVDDDGFSARVTGLGRGEVRAGWLVRAVIAVLVVGIIAAGAAAEIVALDVLFDRELSVDGRAWIDEHRAAYARVVAAFDAHPALRRRAGRDASTVLNDAMRRWQYPAVDPDDMLACESEAGVVQRNRRHLPVTGTCDTSWINGLAAYDEWSTRPADDESMDVFLLSTMTRAHLRRAARQPLVPGAPAPFAVAARDVEALARLTMTHRSQGARLFVVVAEEHDIAAAAGRAGDHTVVVDADDARLLQRAWLLGNAFTSAGATDDDVAAVGRMQSVLACGALSDAFGQDVLAASFLDEHRVERVRRLDRAGCAPPVPRSLEEQLCYTDNPICRPVLAAATLPPFRQRVISSLQRWGLTDLSLTKTPTTKAAPATTVQP
jgi:hypothetical protein